MIFFSCWPIHIQRLIKPDPILSKICMHSNFQCCTRTRCGLSWTQANRLELNSTLVDKLYHWEFLCDVKLSIELGQICTKLAPCFLKWHTKLKETLQTFFNETNNILAQCSDIRKLTIKLGDTNVVTNQGEKVAGDTPLITYATNFVLTTLCRAYLLTGNDNLT